MRNAVALDAGVADALVANGIAFPWGISTISRSTAARQSIQTGLDRRENDLLVVASVHLHVLEARGVLLDALDGLRLDADDGRAEAPRA